MDLEVNIFLSEGWKHLECKTTMQLRRKYFHLVYWIFGKLLLLL